MDSKVRSLVEHGFIVAMCDGRGSANRGASFEGSLKYAMGTQEVLDQVDLVRWMVDRFNVDKLRVAITGLWSYPMLRMLLLNVCFRVVVRRIQFANVHSAIS